MSDVAIRAENLSKRYRLGRRERYIALRDVLARIATSSVNLLRRNPEGTPTRDYLWALKDVSLDVKVGEILGMVGRNGAGKTTLLKVLTKITKPTSGRA